VLEPENREYDPIVLDSSKNWKILGKVLWWIGNSHKSFLKEDAGVCGGRGPMGFQSTFGCDRLN